jgi:hypothetical protein
MLSAKVVNPLNFARFHTTAATLGAGVSSCFTTASRAKIGFRQRPAEKNRYQPIPISERIQARYANPGARANNSLCDNL